MNPVKILLVLGLAAVCGAPLAAQTAGMVKKTAKVVAAGDTVATFRVLGNCGMCEKIIETAALQTGASKASWDSDTGQLEVTFSPAKTSVDALQKAIALAGYDNAGYKAPDDVYEKLHGCCHYDRSGAPSTAKSCEEGQ